MVFRHFLENLRNSEQNSLKSTKIATKLENKCKGFCISIAKNATSFDEILLKFCDRRGAKGCKSDRSHQELSNEYLIFTCKNRRRYNRERTSQHSFDFQVMGFNYYRAAPPFSGACLRICPVITGISRSRRWAATGINIPSSPARTDLTSCFCEKRFG